MALTLNTSLTASNPPVRLGGTTANSFYDSPEVIVADVQVAGAGSVLLYRWDADLASWVASAAGGASLSGAGTFETRWATAGIAGDYTMVATGTTGTWSPKVPT